VLPRDPIHLIINERAGRGQGARAAALAEGVLVRRGAHVDVSHTQGPGHAVELARTARERGAAVVVAVGGDGTLHEVANGLLRGELLRGEKNGATRPVLAQIPVGSGNDYAKMLGISRTDPAQAAAALLDGPAHPVDVGILEGAAPRDAPDAAPELFLNNLGLAFAGDANARI